jgi:hypothetical protein
MKLQVLILMLVATSALGATPTDTTVAFYHGTPDRAGNYNVPSLNWRSAGTVRRDQMFDGHFYVGWPSGPRRVFDGTRVDRRNG